MRQYSGIFEHLQRMAKSDSVGVSSNSSYGVAGESGDQEETYPDDDWYDDDGYDWGDDWYDSWPEELDHDEQWDESTSGAEPPQVDESHDQSAPSLTGDDHESWDETDSAHKGKSKGKRRRPSKGRGKG